MNDYVKKAQLALRTTVDGQFGPNDLRAVLALVAGAVPVATGDLPWIAAMKTVYGLHELHDKARLQAWLRSDGKTLGDPTALPWCGDAVETAMKTGLPDEPFVGALAVNPYWARNWATFGRAAKGYGSVGVFERGPSSGHVGFLVGEDAACYHVLGGNQGDSVSVTRIAKGRLLAARWPITWEGEPAPLPTRPATLPQSVNEV